MADIVVVAVFKSKLQITNVVYTITLPYIT